MYYKKINSVFQIKENLKLLNIIMLIGNLEINALYVTD